MPLVSEFYDFWRGWFAQPLEEKTKFLRSPGKGGYYPPFSESPGYTGNPDPKEYFHYRKSHVGMDLATEDLFYHCVVRAQTWMREAGLRELAGLPAENHVLRILHYPATPDGNVGEAHCDYNLLTVAVPGTAPGLEIFDQGEWVRREKFEEHVGEMLTHYAKVPATPHRVRAPPNTERYKAVLFYLPPNDFVLRPGFTAADYLKEALTKSGTINIGK